MWITFYFCGKVWCNVDNFVDRMWITFLKCWKSNKPTNNIQTYQSQSAPGQAIAVPVLSSKINFYPKNILHFWTMCNSRNPYNRGYFTYYFSLQLAVTNECVPLSPTTQFSTSRSPPKFPLKYLKIIRELLRRTFEKSFIFNNFQLPKNPTIPSNHPKIPPQNRKIPNKTNSFSNKVQ